MDISSPDEIGLPVLMENVPLSPWVRIAVQITTPPGYVVNEARLRTIDDFEIILQVEGRTWTWLEPYGSFEVKPGDIIFNPPGLSHGWAYNAGTHLAIHFDLHANPSLRAMANLHPSERMVSLQPAQVHPRFTLCQNTAFMVRSATTVPFVTPARHPAMWRHQMSRVVEWWQREPTPTLEFQLTAGEIVGWMLRTLAEDAAAAGLVNKTATDEPIMELLRELETLEFWPQDKWPSVGEMARRTGLGCTAFHQRFRAVTGNSPRRYLETRRIHRAQRLLIDTSYTVVEIAAMEGYDDAYHFSRVFKRVTGVSPSRFRSQKIDCFDRKFE